jgi:hypothetical protein
MTWKLTLPTARYDTTGTTVEVGLGTPLHVSITSKAKGLGGLIAGFQVIPSDDPTLTGQPKTAELHANKPLKCDDCYVRENDLIAIYPQVFPWAFGFQVDFRFQKGLVAGVDALELWLSVQTSLLESAPRLTLYPTADETFWKEGRYWVAGHGQTVMIPHPLDRTDYHPTASPETGEVSQIDCFGGFMEKGVIRRARWLLAWSSSPTSKSPLSRSTIEAVYKRFAESPLPLTA